MFGAASKAILENIMEVSDAAGDCCAAARSARGRCQVRRLEKELMMIKSEIQGTDKHAQAGALKLHVCAVLNARGALRYRSRQDSALVPSRAQQPQRHGADAAAACPGLGAGARPVAGARS